METVRFTKIATAQRQLDAAIRILFGGEDELAVVSIVGAALRVLSDLHQKRFPGRAEAQAREISESVVRELMKQEPPPGWRLADSDKQLLGQWLNRRNQQYNYLKHADRKDDPNAIAHDAVGLDGNILDACGKYVELIGSYTPEMWAFCRWHLAVYPCQPGDALETGVEDHGRNLCLHELDRDAQKEAGLFLINQFGGLDA